MSRCQFFLYVTGDIINRKIGQIFFFFYCGVEAKDVVLQCGDHESFDRFTRTQNQQQGGSRDRADYYYRLSIRIAGRIPN